MCSVYACVSDEANLCSSVRVWLGFVTRKSLMSTPLVTVLMPVHNEATYVSRALRSLQGQTLRDVEILVVDDRSHDSTASIVQRHAEADSRVRLIPNSGSGFTEALNSGIQMSKGELIARMDADDFCRRRRLEVQLREMMANAKAVAVGTHGLRVNERGVPVGRLTTGPLGSAGYRRSVETGRAIALCHPSVMFRKRAAESVGMYPADYFPSDDYKLWNKLAQVGEVYALPGLHTLYTLRSRSISADGMLLQQMTMARIEKETELGKDFRSMLEFEEYMAVDVRTWESEKRRWRAEAQRRLLARHLINGRFSSALPLVRSGAVTPSALAWGVRKSLRGW